MHPKEFYKTYQADDEVSELAETMLTLINRESAVHAFEFGMGTGKHLRRLRAKGIETFGIDISILNCIRAQAQLDGIALGDERHLRHFVNFDVVFTVSVLDHIYDVADIIEELKRIANKSVFQLETNDTPAEYYYPHDYESMGFERLKHLWVSAGDGATYYIWKYTK